MRTQVDMLIVDRDIEQRALTRLATHGRRQLGVLYGRRRVGKTYLLTHLWEPTRVFFFTADNTTPQQNRVALIQELSAWLGEPLRPEDYPTWRAVFRLLLDVKTPEPVVVVLDEFQYLGEGKHELGGVASELAAVWDARHTPRPFLLVLCGSAIKPLEALDEGGAALHGRIDWKHKLEPLDYWSAHQLAPFDEPRDRVRAFSVFGGTPRYLAALDPNKSVGENTARLMLAESGEVRLQVETALTQEQSLREVSKYQAILRAIGTGTTELSTIAAKAGLPADTTTRVKVQTLIELGLVKAKRNIQAQGTKPFRYYIADPAFAFYYEYVVRYESALKRNDPLTIWTRYIEPSFDSYVGHVFEVIVEQAYRRLTSTLDLPAVNEWGNWEGVDRARTSLEMDIVGPLVDRRVLSGGIKWNGQPIDISWHFHHLDMLERLATSGVRWAHDAKRTDSPLLWVAAGGFSPEFRRAVTASRPQVYLWTLDDLYQET